MNILITGVAGFIGHALVKALAKEGNEIAGIDNLSPLSNERIKYARLNDLGIDVSQTEYGKEQKSSALPSFRFLKLDVTDREALPKLFEKGRFDCVIHLAAQAGVRRSVDDPFSYAETNLLGFLNVLECCRQNMPARLVFASSSSVYGADSKVPFSETEPADKPVSFYAATKRADELMAYSYSSLYGLSAVALRFFTVYGPWGRPDMAPFIFMKALLTGSPLRLFNGGRMCRDFTFIDDVAECVRRVVMLAAPNDDPFKVYNVCSSVPVNLSDFLAALERITGKKAIVELADMQQGDVPRTMGDFSRFTRDYGFLPHTTINEGLEAFCRWFAFHRQLW